MAENVANRSRTEAQELKQTRAELDNIKTDLNQLQRDIKDLMHAVKGAGTSRIHQARDRAQTTAHDRAEQLREQLHEMQAHARQNLEHARGLAQERPFSAIFGALTIGLVAGLLMGARRK